MNKRKQHVLLTAQQLFLEKGFHLTSVQDILDQSGISKGTFYNYFTSKSECLIAMLEHAQEEAFIRRKALLVGKEVTDKHVLGKQIVVRMKINREHNVIPLFQTVFHSKDPELRSFVKKQHLNELIWLSKRMRDVYGEEISPYALDCAVMVLGLIQQYNLVWSFTADEELDANQLVNFVLRRMDVIVEDLRTTKDSLIGDYAYMLYHKKMNLPYKKEELLKYLDELLHSLSGSDDKRRQCIQFIMTELKSKQPRKHLLETVIHSLYKECIDSSLEIECKELSAMLLQYVNAIE